MARNSKKQPLHVLGIEATKAYNLDTKKEDYTVKKLVTDDVYDWLNRHDIEYTDSGKKVFICNQIRYIDLGLNIETNKE